MNWKFWNKNKTNTKAKAKKKTKTREWVDAIVFAVIAATLIRTFFIEAYTIPTPSMERSLLVGDFLFVSKLNYGPRTPMTPIAFPFAHHTMPLINTKAYWDGLELGYHRLPSFGEVKKGDVVVFNYPMDADSPLYRPVDKRENYIKRCQGVAGDTLSVVEAQVYVNGKKAPNPPEGQIDYTVNTKSPINPDLLQDLHVSMYEQGMYPTMTKDAYNAIKGFSNVTSITPNVRKPGDPDQVYPTNPNHPVGPPNLMLPGKQHDYKWNVDNYGPIIIPKKGWTVKLDSVTYPLYERCISVYENNKVQVVGKDILINGVKTDSYTFKMNY
ncbi:MAG: signal peptidase [Mucilaginibacter sp.]|nr:signal peptidase [Mucilaginibacter sp.]